MDWVGYIAGVVSSVVTAAVTWVIATRLSPGTKKRVAARARHPFVGLRLLFSNEYRAIRRRIDGLFDAWTRKDPVQYRDAWDPQARRIRSFASTGDTTHTLDEIVTSFNESCARYRRIAVPWVVVENIRFEADDFATVQVSYRMELIRGDDNLPFVEDGGETYTLRKAESTWRILANWDRYQIYGGIEDVIG